MIITPLRNYVLLEEIKPPSTTDSGLIVSETADREPTYLAKVANFGDEAGDFEVGDVVLIQKHLFNEVTLEKKEFLIGKAEGIMAVIKDVD